MESRHLDNKPLGKVLDGFGYVVFVAGLLCALAVAYFERGQLATKRTRASSNFGPLPWRSWDSSCS